MRVWLAEFIGTFALLFAGTLAIATGQPSLTVALAFAVSVAVMIAAVGAISQAHFNPAVTLGFWLLGRLAPHRLLLYWSAELTGALAALLALRGLIGAEPLAAVSYGATVPAGGLGRHFGLELVFSFVLMFVIAQCVLQRQAAAGLYIGLAVLLGALFGASMNPARSFAPALLAGLWQGHWLYWLAPLAGAALAARLARYLWREGLPGAALAAREAA